MDGKKEVSNSILFFLISVMLISLFAGASIYEINSKNSSLTKYITPKYENVRVSFIINDITFKKEDQLALNNALTLAKKYNVTFDLGVIAQQFSENSDPETFKIYQDNKDVFEIIAHGLTEGSDLIFIEELNESGSYGEFHIQPINRTVPAEIQEEHIKKMKGIFERNNLTTATKIFTVPFYSGDENTIKLAEKNGYKLIIQQLSFPVQNYIEKNYGKIIASEDYAYIPPYNIFSNADLIIYNNKLSDAMGAGQKNIYVSLHPVNLEILKNADKFFKDLIEKNPGVKMRFISSRFDTKH